MIKIQKAFLQVVVLSFAIAPSFSFANLSCSYFFKTAKETKVKDSNPGRYLIPASKPLRADQIHFKIEGPVGAPVVVLIHGLGGSLDGWNNVSAQLSQRYRVLSYDQRGHGRTMAEGLDYTTQTMARDLKVLLDHLQIEKVDIVAHSLGSRTAMSFVDLFPNQVRSLVLEDMDMRSRQDDAAYKVARNLEKAQALSEMKFYYPHLKAAVEDMLPTLKNDLNRTIRYVQRRSVHTDENGGMYFDRPHVNVLYGVQGNMDNFGPVLKRSQQPMLFIRANPWNSPFFTDKGVAHILKNGQNVFIEEISEAGHGVHHDRHDDFMSLVFDFLENQKVSDDNRGRYFRR